MDIPMMLNALVMKNKFEYKDPDKYIYSSITQPPLEIVSKNDSTDQMDYTVICPNCKEHVIFGTDTFMLKGYTYCSNKGCRDFLINKLKL